MQVKQTTLYSLSTAIDETMKKGSSSTSYDASAHDLSLLTLLGPIEDLYLDKKSKMAIRKNKTTRRRHRWQQSLKNKVFLHNRNLHSTGERAITPPSTSRKAAPLASIVVPSCYGGKNGGKEEEEEEECGILVVAAPPPADKEAGSTPDDNTTFQHKSVFQSRDDVMTSEKEYAMPEVRQENSITGAAMDVKKERKRPRSTAPHSTSGPSSPQRSSTTSRGIKQLTQKAEALLAMKGETMSFKRNHSRATTMKMRAENSVLQPGAATAEKSRTTRHVVVGRHQRKKNTARDKNSAHPPHHQDIKRLVKIATRELAKQDATSGPTTIPTVVHHDDQQNNDMTLPAGGGADPSSTMILSASSSFYQMITSMLTIDESKACLLGSSRWEDVDDSSPQP